MFLYEISPDGKWLAVWTSARTDVKIYPSDGGAPTLLCAGCASAGAEERGVTPPLVSWPRDGELRRMAARLLQNERPGYSLQRPDLVHEVYLRLVNARELDWQHRAHFFADRA